MARQRLSEPLVRIRAQPLLRRPHRRQIGRLQPLGQAPHAPVQRHRIVAKGRALQLQLVEAPVAEPIEIGLELVRERRVPLQRPPNVRKIAAAQRLHECLMVCRLLGHLAHAPGRLGAYHLGVAREQIVVQVHRIVDVGPRLHDALREAVEDHGEEVVRDRHVPLRQQLLFQMPVVVGQLVEAHLVEARLGRGEHVVEMVVELLDALGQLPVLGHETPRRAEHGEALGKPFRPRGRLVVR
jgi:hypothetical protein